MFPSLQKKFYAFLDQAYVLLGKDVDFLGFINDLGREFLKPFVFIVIFWNFSVILHDEFLKSHFFKVTGACVCLFAFSCLVTLSKICTLRKKGIARNKIPSTLCDSDIESDDETEVVHEEEPEILCLPEFILIFCKFRPAYGFVFAFAIFLLISAAAMNTLALSSQGHVEQRDYLLSMCVVSNVLCPLMTLVSILAFFPDLYTPEHTEKNYKPFDEFVQVPMKVFASRVFAILYCALPHVLTCFFFLSMTIYGLHEVYHMPEAQIKRFKKDSGMESIHSVLIYVVMCMNIAGLLFLLEGFLTACDVVKENLLFLCEKNWERNMCAFEYLLPQTEVSSLEELKNALEAKKGEVDLAADEEKAFVYISRPFWKTKRAFVDEPREAVSRPKTPSTVNGSPRNPTQRSRSESATTPSDNGSPLMKFSPPLTRSRARLRKTSEPFDLSSVPYRA